MKENARGVKIHHNEKGKMLEPHALGDTPSVL